MNPNLYLDVDGVLLFIDQENTWLFNLLLSNKNRFWKIFWLSSWTRNGTDDLLYKYHPKFKLLKAKPLKWVANKTEAINWKRPFIWLEDGIIEEERRIFNQKATPGQQVWECYPGEWIYFKRKTAGR